MLIAIVERLQDERKLLRDEVKVLKEKLVIVKKTLREINFSVSGYKNEELERLIDSI